MKTLEKYGPQTRKIEDLFDAFSNMRLTNLWSGVRFAQTGHYTDEDWTEVAHARDCAYLTALKAGRGAAWILVQEKVLGAKSGDRDWRVGQLESFLGLMVYDLVGTDFTQERLDLLLAIYYDFWDQVGKLFEVTQPSSPERLIAVELYTNIYDLEEALATTKRALSA